MFTAWGKHWGGGRELAGGRIVDFSAGVERVAGLGSAAGNDDAAVGQGAGLVEHARRSHGAGGDLGMCRQGCAGQQGGGCKVTQWGQVHSFSSDISRAQLYSDL